MNKYLLEVHGSSTSEKTLKSLRFVKDEVCHVGGVTNFRISRELIFSVKNAPSKYITDLEIQNEIQSKEKLEQEDEEEGAGCITDSKTED